MALSSNGSSETRRVAMSQAKSAGEMPTEASERSFWRHPGEDVG